MSIYMDYNASTPIHPEAAEAMRLVCGHKNPSSPHSAGRKARALLENARADVAAFCAAPPANVIFTSSGTEANALAMGFKASSYFISAVEHISVSANAPQDTEILAVDENGVVCLDDLREKLFNLRKGEKPFCSVMLANNETGIIQPIAQIAEIVKAAGGFLHCDCVAAAGKLPLDIKSLGVDALTISAHKFGAGAGIGALVLAENALFEPLIKGGAQEFGQRAGTENLIGIAGFAAATKITEKNPNHLLAQWRDELEKSLPQGSIVFGNLVARLENTSCFALPNISAEKALIMFDLAGICLSAGSACSSGKISASPTLLAQGVEPQLAKCAVRVSLGWQSEAEHITYFSKIAHEICANQNSEAA